MDGKKYVTDRGEARDRYQLVAELNGGVMVARLLPLAAATEDADPLEPRLLHRHGCPFASLSLSLSPSYPLPLSSDPHSLLSSVFLRLDCSWVMPLQCKDG